jgi:four helix bundle protein
VDASEWKARTKRFAVDTVCLCSTLPRSIELGHIRGQLLRSATSVAANYRAACHGKSKADFIAKLGTVEEGADESAFWMELIQAIRIRCRLDLNPETCRELERLRDEATQLKAITIASRKTARTTLGAVRN